MFYSTPVQGITTENLPSYGKKYMFCIFKNLPSSYKECHCSRVLFE